MALLTTAWCQVARADRWDDRRREAALWIRRDQLRLAQDLGRRDWLRVQGDLQALQVAGARLNYYADADNEALHIRVPFVQPPEGSVLVPFPNPWAADHGRVVRPVAPHNGYTPRFVPSMRAGSSVPPPPPGPSPVYPWRSSGP